MKPKSQAQKILEYLLKGNILTPLQALKWWGCFRLGARIWEIKRKGYLVKNNKRASYAQYKLVGKRLGYGNLMIFTEADYRAYRNPDDAEINDDRQNRNVCKMRQKGSSDHEPRGSGPF